MLEGLNMPKLATTATVTTTTTVTLRPLVRKRLLNELHAYAELKAQLDAIEVVMDEHKATIRTLRESTGAASLELDGFKMTDVRGTTKKLDKKKFVALGGSLAMLEDATTVKPKKPYELVTVPGEKKPDWVED